MSTPASPLESQEAKATPSDDTGNTFQCNICLDDANSPVVTRCGHLYCWPCLYNWLSRGKNTCPVCKAGVTRETVIPLYGRGSERVDPRTTTPGAPPRPTADRPEAPPQNPGFFPQMRGNGIRFHAQVGFIPSLFGLYVNNTGHGWQTAVHGIEGQQAAETLKKLMIILAVFVFVSLMFL